MRRWIPVFAVGLAGVFATHTVGAWGPVADGLAADATFDWVAVQAITGDGTPHDPLHELFQYQGYSTPVELHPHPRTPGALLLQTPMLLVGQDAARPVMSAVSVVSLLVLAWAVGRLTGWSPWLVAGLTSLAAWSTPVLLGFVMGTQSLLIAALIAVGWAKLRDGDDLWAGVALAVAATLKIYPALIVVLLWWKHPRAVKWAAGVGVGLTLAGLILPDVTVAGTVAAFVGVEAANAANPHNLAVGLPLWAVGLAVIALAWVAKQWTLSTVMVAGTVGMVVLSPVVWVHYLVVLFVPAVVALNLVRSRKFHDRPERVDRFKPELKEEF